MNTNRDTGGQTVLLGRIDTFNCCPGDSLIADKTCVVPVEPADDEFAEITKDVFDRLQFIERQHWDDVTVLEWWELMVRETISKFIERHS